MIPETDPTSSSNWVVPDPYYPNRVGIFDTPDKNSEIHLPYENKRGVKPFGQPHMGIYALSLEI